MEARDDGADIDLHCRDAVLSLAERAERRDYWGNRPCDWDHMVREIGRWRGQCTHTIGLCGSTR